MARTASNIRHWPAEMPASSRFLAELADVALRLDPWTQGYRMGRDTWNASLSSGEPGGTGARPADASALEKVTPRQLAYLGQRDKAGFFDVLKPAAMAAQSKYGVPWQVTLAQAALESGWGRHAVGGYNIFGVKGVGPAGSVSWPTREWQEGHFVLVMATFARYDSFDQAIDHHGALFRGSRYDKATQGFALSQDPIRFANDLQGTYATSPTYAHELISIMRRHGLL